MIIVRMSIHRFWLESKSYQKLLVRSWLSESQLVDANIFKASVLQTSVDSMLRMR